MFAARRLALLLPLLLLLATACSQTKPGEGIDGRYSDDFIWWFYPTNAVAIDVSNLRFGGDTAPQELAMARLKELAVAQETNNQRMLDATAPSDRVPYHRRIVDAINRYERSTAAVRLAGQPEDFSAAAALVDDELVLLLETVIDCYAQSTACR